MLLVSDLNFFLPVIHSFIHSWLIDWYKHIKQVQTVKFSKRKYMAACKKETFSCLNSLISTPQLVQSCSRFRSALWHSVMCFNESMTDISSCDFSYTGQRCFWLFQWWPTILLFQFICVLFTCLRKPSFFLLSVQLHYYKMVLKSNGGPKILWHRRKTFWECHLCTFN